MNTRKINFYQSLFFVAALVFTFSQTATAQEDERQVLSAADVPAEARAIKDFAPKAWKMVSQTNGDLNGDKLADAILTVAPNDHDLALIVAFKKADGGFSKAMVAPNALHCECGSVLGDGTPDVKIERGQIIFNGSSGSREERTIKMRFRWEAATKRFLLIGDDIEIRDRLTAETQTLSSNYLTNLRVTIITDPKQRDKHLRQKIKPQRLYLDEFDYQSYWEKFEVVL